MTFTLNICAKCNTAFKPPQKIPHQRCCSRRCGLALARDIRAVQISHRTVKGSSITLSERAEINRARRALVNAWIAPTFDDAAAHDAFLRLRAFVDGDTRSATKPTIARGEISIFDQVTA